MDLSIELSHKRLNSFLFYDNAVITTLSLFEIKLK